jgi:hypothetical protein
MLLLTALVSAISLQAQFKTALDVKTGQKMSFKEAHFQNFLGIKNGKLYTFGSSDNNIYRNKPGVDFYLRTYDIDGLFSFNLVDEIEIEGQKYKGAKMSYFSAMANDAGFHLFTEGFSKKLKRKFLVVQTIDENGRLSYPKELASMSCKFPWSREFIMRWSEDHSQILVYADIDDDVEDEREGEMQIPRIWVYNETFDEHWTVVASEGLEGQNGFNATGISISNDGQILILGYQLKIRMNEGKLQAVDQYALLRHNDKKRSEIIAIESDTNAVQHMTMDIDPDGYARLIGFISKIDETTILGSVVLSVNPEEMEVLSTHWQNFDSTFLNQFPVAYEREIKRYEVEGVVGYTQGTQKKMNSFWVKDMVHWDDGGFTAVAERTYFAFNGYATYPSFNYDELVVMDFNKNGELNWVRKVPKFQRTVEKSSLWGSFFVQQETDGIHIVYNDHADNPSLLSNDQMIEEFGGPLVGFTSAVVKTSITRDGEMRYEMLYEEAENNTLVNPHSIFQISPNQNLGIFVTPRAGQLQFFKMEVD